MSLNPDLAVRGEVVELLRYYDAAPGRRSLVARIEGHRSLGALDLPARAYLGRRGRGGAGRIRRAVLTRQLPRRSPRRRGAHRGRWLAAQCRPRTQLSWATAEKGTSWLRISVHGTAGHAANPSNMDNALVTAAEVITRLATQQGEPVPAEQLTVTPTGVRGGIAINSIPELVEIDVDARTLPGQGRAEVVDELRTALGDLLDVVELDWLHELYTASAPSSTRLLDSVRRIADDLVPGTELVPSLVVGSTDAEYFRQAGARAYGFAMTSDYASPGEFAGMFHGANERIDVRSLELSTRLWEQLARTF